MRPRVSVVVPTIGRPGLVARAARSALRQTMSDLEVVVVQDGPDPATRAALSELADTRLRAVALPRPSGIGAARNAGIREARADWIALLDDDDEWADGKLAEQIAAAEASPRALPIVACRVQARGRSGRVAIWPRRLPSHAEPLSDYLLARRGPFWGETLVHTSTLLAPRALFAAVPFREDLRKHEDLDWLLRAIRVPGAGVEFPSCPEPLAVWDVSDDRPRASAAGDWEAGLAWIRSVQDLVTPRAYAGFLLTWLSVDAAADRSLDGLARLPWEAFRRGRPKAVDLLVFLAAWTVPAGLRRAAAKRSGASAP